MSSCIEFGEDVRWRTQTWIWQRIAQAIREDGLAAQALDKATHHGDSLDMSQLRPEDLAAFGRVLKSLEQRTLDLGPGYFDSAPSFGRFLARLGGLRQAVNTALVSRGREEVEDTTLRPSS